MWFNENESQMSIENKGIKKNSTNKDDEKSKKNDSLAYNFYYKKSRLQQLKGFYYTYQKRSLTKAAQEMGLSSASAITNQIKSLEEDLGVKLFIQEGNKIIPTAKADMLYEMAVPVIHGADSLFEKFLLESKRVNDDCIHFACHPYIASDILPKHIKKFQEKNPDVVFKIDIIQADKAIDEIIEDKLNFAIFPVEENKKNNKEVDYINFFESKMSLVLSKDHWLAKKPEELITKEDLAKCNLIFMDKDLYKTNKYLEFLKDDSRLRLNIVFKGANWEIVKSMIKNNTGVSVMAEKYINDCDRDILLTKNVLNIFPEFKYYFIIKKQCLINKLTVDFLELLDNNFSYKIENNYFKYI